MAGHDPTGLEKALQARDQIAGRLLAHPDVSLIDIGYDPEAGSGPRRLAVRIHIRRPLDRAALGIPDEIDGIPVRFLAGEYRLE